MTNDGHNVSLDQQLSNISGNPSLQSLSLVPFAPVVNDIYGHGYATQLSIPHEISEPILWSAQFVNAEHNPFLNPLYDEIEVIPRVTRPSL